MIMLVDLTGIPDGWFLWGLQDMRKPITYVGDTHTHLYWRCKLNRDRGGSVVDGRGRTPQDAVNQAIDEIRKGIENNRWTWVREEQRGGEQEAQQH